MLIAICASCTVAVPTKNGIALGFLGTKADEVTAMGDTLSMIGLDNTKSFGVFTKAAAFAWGAAVVGDTLQHAKTVAASTAANRAAASVTNNRTAAGLAAVIDNNNTAIRILKNTPVPIP